MASLAQSTPGDPQGPGSGEPTIMAFRRPPDRPTLAVKPGARASGDVPVVLKLPDLSRPATADDSPAPAILAMPDSESVPQAQAGKPWISMALWIATGVLAVVAAGVLMVGRPTPEPAGEEAPAWSPPPIGGSAAPTPYNSEAQAAPFAGQGSAAPGGGYPATSTPGSTQPWNNPAASGRSLPSQPGYPSTENNQQTNMAPGAGPPGSGAVAPYPNGTYPMTGYPTAGYPQTGTPAGAPSSAAPADVGPGGAIPNGTVQPQSGATGFGAIQDPWPNTPPDQSKKLEVHTHPMPVDPNGPMGAARLDGDIRNLETRPGDDSTR